MSTTNVLFVCTGNICRSPMAEYMTRAKAQALGVDLVVSSVGSALQGEQPTSHASSVMTDRGIDMTSHRSRTMTQEIVAEADLVLTMTGRHAREAAVFDFDTVYRVYTLRELARLSDTQGSRNPDISLEDFLKTLARIRPTTQVGAGGPGDDIEDPFRRRRRRYVRAASEIEGAIDVIMSGVIAPGVRGL